MSTAWKNSGLLPTSGMLWWHAHESSTSTSGNIDDLSGNARHIVQASTPPTLEYSTTNKAYGWHFDNSNPLQTASGSIVTPKHIFILATLDYEEFDQERGLFSGKTTNDLLWGDTANAFADPGGDTYLLSGADPDTNFQAPVAGIAELIEITDAAGIALDGLSYGQRKADIATKWAGTFFDSIGYSDIKTGDDLLRIYQYYNYRYAQHRRGLPFYFPDDQLMQIPRKRFYEAPKDWDAITDDFEFEDAGRSFNEVAMNTVQEWEYAYDIHWQGINTTTKDPEHKIVFDSFADQARRKNAFVFRSKDGAEHEGVRIKRYNRTHQGHKPWHMEVQFDLVQFPGS